MKKFILNTFLFSLPIIFSSYYLDIFISKNLKKSNTYANGEYSVWNDIFEGKINADILIYGSSRAWKHINPEMLNDSLHFSTYNLGIDGHNFWLEYLRHSLYLEKKDNPKYIILSLDIYTLMKKPDLFNSDQFLPYMLCNSKIQEATKDYIGFNFFDYQIPLVRYFGKLEALKVATHNMFKSDDIKYRLNGYKATDEFWNNDFDNAKKLMNSYEVKFDKPSEVLFDKFLKFCSINNTKIIFVYSPEYIEGQKFVKNRKDVINIYKKYSIKYKIPFYDYSKDTISYQKKYFYNSAHLNKQGAELFTLKLVDTLKKSNLFVKL